MKTLLKQLVRLYPRSWRDRYGTEIEALIEDVRVRPSDIAGMLMGALLMQKTIWRGIALMALGAAVGLGLGAWLHGLQPMEFRAVGGLGSDDAKAWSRVDAKQLALQALDKQTLLVIMARNNLYPEARTRQLLEDVVAAMRRDVSVSKLPGARGGISVEFHYPRADQAAKAHAELMERLRQHLSDQGLGRLWVMKVRRGNAEASPFRPHQWEWMLGGVGTGLLTATAALLLPRRRHHSTNR